MKTTTRLALNWKWAGENWEKEQRRGIKNCLIQFTSFKSSYHFSYPKPSSSSLNWCWKICSFAHTNHNFPYHLHSEWFMNGSVKMSVNLSSTQFAYRKINTFSYHGICEKVNKTKHEWSLCCLELTDTALSIIQRDPHFYRFSFSSLFFRVFLFSSFFFTQQKDFFRKVLSYNFWLNCTTYTTSSNLKLLVTDLRCESNDLSHIIPDYYCGKIESNSSDLSK